MVLLFLSKLSLDGTLLFEANALTQYCLIIIEPEHNKTNRVTYGVPINKNQTILSLRLVSLYNWCILLRLTSGFVNPRTALITSWPSLFSSWQILMLIIRKRMHQLFAIHWTELISSHHTIFAPVQKLKIALPKFKFHKKVQGFVETLQIMSFQNDLQILHSRGPSKGTIISKSRTFECDIKFSSDRLSIYF